MSEAIVVKGVTKTFGSKVAVRDLELVVPAGALYGFIGPNGAGKTTTIRMIMSILFQDRGEISVLGHASALDAKDRIGYLPEERGVYKKMKVGAYLSYIARLKNTRAGDLKKRIQGWLDKVGLLDVEQRKYEELSKGMQQKAQFLAAVIHEPDLLILDEPFSGLDPVNMRLLRELILEQHRRGATIILSTHVMTQAEQICDQIVMINDGAKVLDDSLESIRTKFDPRTVLFEPLQPDADLASLSTLDGVEAVEQENGHWAISLAEGTDPSRAIGDIVATVTPARIELHRPTLEDVFVQIVTGSETKSRQEVRQLRAALRETAATEEATG
jgi:ABC-2 type transport system ATP-binding protein